MIWFLKRILFIGGLGLIAATLFGAGELYDVSQETSADVSFYLKKHQENPKKDLKLAKNEENTLLYQGYGGLSSPNSSIIEMNLEPDKKILKVPFIVQAPLQNWQAHKESCEEAALLILLAYLKGENLAKDSANKELIKMKKFQVENYGKEKDLFGQEFVRFSQDYADLNLKTIENLSIEDIKREINAEKPLIIPVIAKYLKNPYYPHQGYHMLVIIGYNNEEIITNDPGTRAGQNFKYSFQKIKKAGEDYNNIAFVADPHTN